MSEVISLFLENEAATQGLGRSLASVFRQVMASGENLLVTLDGELGTGKTTLVRACLRELGIQGAIKSPTYTLLEPYEVDSGFDLKSSSEILQKRLKIAHLDLYRLQEPEELDYIGGRNLSHDYDLVLIEWPEKGQGFLPEAKLKIQLNHKDRGREVKLLSSNQALKSVLKDIKNR